MKSEKLKSDLIRLKMQSSKFPGFTLVELLVSLLILSTVSSIVIAIVWVSLKSIVKVNNMHLIRQNGNFAISQVTKMLQYAKRFEGVSTNGASYTTACQAPGTPLQPYNYVRLTAADNGTIVLGCLSSPATIASNSASLISTAGFTVTSCNFTCTQVTIGSPYNIGIQFTIQKRVSGNIFDEPAPLLFQTSATIRNFTQ